MNVVTTEEVKQFLQITWNDEDALICSLIGVAEELIEKVLNKALSEYEVIPKVVKESILLLIAYMFEERKAGKDFDSVEMLNTVKYLLFSERNITF